MYFNTMSLLKQSMVSEAFQIDRLQVDWELSTNLLGSTVFFLQAQLYHQQISFSLCYLQGQECA